MELKYHGETCTSGGSEAKHSFAAPAGSAPTCGKCGRRRCQYYGLVGGYSVQCKKCNEAQGKQRRAASKRRMKPHNK